MKKSMPELPEVETLCRQLKKVIVNTEVQELVILDSKLNHVGRLVGWQILSVRRRGKFLELGFENGEILNLHLRMSGRLLWQHHQDALPVHTRFQISFSQGRIICIDPRRFATLSLQKRQDCAPPVADPLKNFHASSLKKTAQGRQLPVKSFLLDQNTIAGIGNIYACEILHRAFMSPWRKAGSLSLKEWQRVAAAGLSILRKATACRGTSVSDWLDLHGKKGEYQNHLTVYGRAGCACPYCGEKVQRMVLSGRGTYFCPSCQK
jgi:formamidopyrimidine-DNA glycosylase